MPDTMHIIVQVGLGLGIVGPILVAVNSLRGLRAKRIYPLLRVKQRDGIVTAWVVAS